MSDNHHVLEKRPLGGIISQALAILPFLIVSSHHICHYVKFSIANYVNIKSKVDLSDKLVCLLFFSG